MARSPRLFNLPRPARAAVDAAMLAHIVATGLREGRRRQLSIADRYRFVRNQVVLGRAFAGHKYVKFGRRIFMDSYAPPWPSPGFDALLRSYAGGTERGRRFIDYAVVAVTQRCMFRCAHCYAIDMLDKRDALSLDDLKGVVRTLCEVGLGVLSLEGGEPLLRFDDLVELIELAAPRTTPWISTTGWGLTAARARRLKEAGLVGAVVSLDHHDPARHNAQRGNPRAFDAAVRALRLLRQAGVFPVVATVLSRELLAEEQLERFLAFLRSIGVGMVQGLDPMPAGRWLDEPRCNFSRRELERLMALQVSFNTDRRRLHLPALGSRAYLEHESRVGCNMGCNHLYVDAAGHVHPCVYLNLSFGNVKTDGLMAAWERLRRCVPQPLGGPCPVFSLSRRIARHHAAGADLPLAPEISEEVCRDLHRRPLPGLFQELEPLRSAGVER